MTAEERAQIAAWGKRIDPADPALIAGCARIGRRLAEGLR